MKLLTDHKFVRTCDRTECPRAAQYHVFFDSYSPTDRPTKACPTHAIWWVDGGGGLSLGRIKAIGR